MKYIKLEKNSSDQQIYARIDDDGLCRVTCIEENPEYQDWLAAQTAPIDTEDE